VTPLLVVAAAMMDAQRRVLLADRPTGQAMAGLWEFPGGKIEAGETPEQALVRELQEEIGLTVAPENLKPFSFASHAYPDFHLLMPLFICRVWLGEPQPLEGQRLVWAPLDALKNYPMPAADIPLAEALIRAHAHTSPSPFAGEESLA
jgi:8-oxo-dGTP diphosphatase